MLLKSYYFTNTSFWKERHDWLTTAKMIDKDESVASQWRLNLESWVGGSIWTQGTRLSGHSPNKAMAVSSVSLLSILAAQWLNSPASIVQSVVELDSTRASDIWSLELW